jgi:hypothetical protein
MTAGGRTASSGAAACSGQPHSTSLTASRSDGSAAAAAAAAVEGAPPAPPPAAPAPWTAWAAAAAEEEPRLAPGAFRWAFHCLNQELARLRLRGCGGFWEGVALS